MSFPFGANAFVCCLLAFWRHEFDPSGVTRPNLAGGTLVVQSWGLSLISFFLLIVELHLFLLVVVASSITKLSICSFQDREYSMACKIPPVFEALKQCAFAVGFS